MLDLNGVNSSLRTDHLHEVIAVIALTDSTYILRCERKGIGFFAGQCANLGVPGTGVNREYSTYSGEDDPYLDFLIREVRGGIVSAQLRNLRPGDEVELHGFYGDFRIKTPTPTARYRFIATGTGIAPFHSYVLSYPDLNYQLLHGIRSLSERYNFVDYDRSRYVSCVTGESGGDFSGRVTDFLKAHPVGIDEVCYLCGNRAMISEVYELLRAQGVPSDNILAEVFF